MNSTSKRFAALAVGTAAVMGTGIAFAAWTASGSGSGYGKGKSISFTVNTTTASAPTADVEPGSNGTLVFTLSSTGLSNTAVLTGVTEPTPPSPNTCAVSLNTAAVTAWFTAHDESTHASDTTLDVPAAGGTYSIANALTVGSASDNSCQGQPIALPITAAISTK